MNLPDIVKVEVVGGIDWIAISGVVATLVAVVAALGLGVSAHLQANKLRKRQERHRILDEIIRWGIDIMAAGASHPVQAVPPEVRNVSQLLGDWAKIGAKNDAAYILAFLGRGQYLAAAVRNISDNLQSRIKSINNLLEKHRNVSWANFDAISDVQNIIERISEIELVLKQALNKLSIFPCEDRDGLQESVKQNKDLMGELQKDMGVQIENMKQNKDLLGNIFSEIVGKNVIPLIQDAASIKTQDIN